MEEMAGALRKLMVQRRSGWCMVNVIGAWRKWMVHGESVWCMEEVFTGVEWSVTRAASLTSSSDTMDWWVRKEF